MSWGSEGRRAALAPVPVCPGGEGATAPMGSAARERERARGSPSGSRLRAAHQESAVAGRVNDLSQ